MNPNGRLSLQEAVARFFILPASHLLRIDKFPRAQELDVEPMAPDDCYLLLFVSHRWETPNHPDPAGKQLGALKSLIYLICDAFNALSTSNNSEKLSFVPSLRQYGALHAVLLVTRLLSALSNKGSDIERSNAREWLPNHIGVWYDFTCLPQTPRTNQQEREFQKTLLALPELLLSDETSLVAIRDVGDDYESRGWCFAEARLSSEKMASRSLVLRLDRLGTSSALLIATEEAATRFNTALDAWEGTSKVEMVTETSWKTIVSQTSIAPETLPLSEDDSPVLSLSRMVRPSIEWVALLLAELSRQEGRDIDFAEVVLHLLKEKGLHCSEDKDLIYVGLLALLWSCNVESRLATFFRECLQRHVGRDGLLMRVTTRGQARSGDENRTISSENLVWRFL